MTEQDNSPLADMAGIVPHVPIYRNVKIDVTQDPETQAIICIEQIIADLEDHHARRRVLQYLLDRHTLNQKKLPALWRWQHQKNLQVYGWRFMSM